LDAFACQPDDDRLAYISEASARRDVAPIIIEKDFWVCWVLRRLFTSSEKALCELTFKGGTSLSKVFSAISRFSEDIDLTINRDVLAYKLPENFRSASNSARDKALERLRKAGNEYVRDILQPLLLREFSLHLGSPNHRWNLTISDKPQDIIFAYPSALPGELYQRFNYIPRNVRLEFGVRGDPWPTLSRAITPFLAEEFPDQFKEASCLVKVLTSERTFWEKATILHAEHHLDRLPKARLARHYYDLSQLYRTPTCATALENPDLLRQVVEHKTMFHGEPKAKYELAVKGTLRLIPQPQRVGDLRQDYDKTKIMIFGDAPDFDEILANLQALEDRINN
jgi:hypothetical protein